MKKALVTGGAGFIGSHLVDRLISEGEWSVVVIDNFSSGRIDNLKHHIGSPLVKIVNGDLKSIEAIQSILIDVDVVFHFAANPEVRVSTINPQTHFNENIIATFNLLEAMRKKNVGELIFASSSSVYGEPKEIPVSEDAPIKPISVYGASKAACENLIHAYSHLYGIKAAVLRYANVVGGRMRHGVIYDFIVKLLKRSDELEILGDGTQIRSYIHVKDAIEAVMIIEKKGIKT
ncbi:MAG: SDR family NAD(P)-dependent oxidoreductase, partial [Acidilobaceae archaeon]